jgi:hypothetical protein
MNFLTLKVTDNQEYFELESRRTSKGERQQSCSPHPSNLNLKIIVFLIRGDFKHFVSFTLRAKSVTEIG